MKTPYSPMKTSSYRRNSSWTPIRTALLCAVLIAIAIFALDTVLSGALREYTRSAGNVVWTAAARVTVTNWNTVIASKKTLIARNAALQEELAIRDEEHARFASLVVENTALKEMVHMATGTPGITARVVSTFRSSPYGTFVIAAGSNEGVHEGSLVLTPGGFVFGKVTDVDSESAMVQSLFAPGLSTDFIVDDLAFTAEGRGGGNTRAEVSRDAVVAVGDVVLAPTYGGNPAGVIGSIESASSSATKTLYIRIPINLGTLQFVYVVSR